MSLPAKPGVSFGLCGAGLVYFANYPMFLDICERDVLLSAPWPLSDALVHVDILQVKGVGRANLRTDDPVKLPALGAADELQLPGTADAGL